MILVSLTMPSFTGEPSAMAVARHAPSLAWMDNKGDGTTGALIGTQHI
jgi:hypothetical protein